MIVDPSRTQRLFACLGDPSRFRVVTTLAAGEYCVTDLARVIGLSQSCTTRHLQALQREGLVVGLRNGKRVVFRLNTDEPMVAGLVGWLSTQQSDRELETAGARRQPSPTSRKPSEPESSSEETPEPASRRAEIEDFLL